MISIDEKIIAESKADKEPQSNVCMEECSELMQAISKDSLICYDMGYANKYIDNIGSQWIEDCEFLENGKIRLFLKDGWKGECDESQRISSSD